MADSPASGDAPDRPSDPPTEEADPGSPDSPLLFGVTLWRDSVVASLGVLVLAAGVEGWWYFVGNGFDNWEYTVIDLVGDLAFVFAGTFLLFVALGAAGRRVRSD
ncbi:MAG: hypothetical protein ABEH83_03960 [Halobacterium sp.]